MSIIYSFVDHSRLTCPYDLMGGFLLEIKARKREREREREREGQRERVFVYGTYWCTHVVPTYGTLRLYLSIGAVY